MTYVKILFLILDEWSNRTERWIQSSSANFLYSRHHRILSRKGGNNLNMATNLYLHIIPRLVSMQVRDNKT